jgi:V/A-type H+-transporting ATPase subunit K
MEIILLYVLVISIGTVVYGVKALKNKQKGSLKKAIGSSASLFALGVMAMFVMIGMGRPVFATEAMQVAAASAMSMGEGFKYLAAALSTGLATIGTGMAVGSVGSSAIGAVSEDPTILGKTLIFVGMAEGIAIYGIIVSILILFI